MCHTATLLSTGRETSSGAAPDFGDRLLEILNNGATALMISLGHRTGLFDTLADLPPCGSQAIADAAGLDERYVREWLGAMVTARIVRYHAERRSYTLPRAHAAWLTRGASPNNAAVFAQYIPLLAQVEDDIVDCFRTGGGVPYARFTHFHEVMAEDSAQSVVAALSTQILPLVDGLQGRLEAGIDVLDLGCGRGNALLRLAAMYPNSRFTGCDFSAEAITWARREASRLGLANLRFAELDAARLADQSAYDWITTFDAVHDQKDPAAVLAAIHRALRDDGVYLMQDVKGSSHLENNLEHPFGPLLYTISTMHCMTVSLAQGGAGLGTLWGRELAERMLREAGFKRVDVHELAHDPQNYFYVMRKR
jgi:SAM-dependent methyltransferase